MFDLGTIEADPKKLADGVWHEIWREPDTSIDGKVVAEPTDGPCVLIVPYGIAYERVMEEEQRPYLERIRERKLTDDDRRKILGRVLARAVFRGCVNITVSGEALKWTEEKAAELMADDRWIRLREFVIRKAGDRKASAAREEAQALGN